MKITQSQLKRIIKEELTYAQRNIARGGNPGVDVDPPAPEFKLYAPGDDPFNDWVEPVGVYDTMDLLKAAWEGSYVGDREDMTVVKPDGTAVPAYQVPELGGYAG